jgi:hypothetical protein
LQVDEIVAEALKGLVMPPGVAAPGVLTQEIAD